MDDRSYFRMGAMAAVLGGVLALVGNVLHPRWTDLEDTELYAKIADSGIWKVDQLILLGVSPLLLGMPAIRTRRLAPWMGWAAVVGGVVSIGVGLAGLADVDADSLVVPFLVGSVLVTLWVLGAGFSLWQGADAPDRTRGLRITPL